MRDAGLEVREDGMGNIFGRWHGTDKDAGDLLYGAEIRAIDGSAHSFTEYLAPTVHHRLPPCTTGCHRAPQAASRLQSSAPQNTTAAGSSLLSPTSPDTRHWSSFTFTSSFNSRMCSQRRS